VQFVILTSLLACPPPFPSISPTELEAFVIKQEICLAFGLAYILLGLNACGVTPSHTSTPERSSMSDTVEAESNRNDVFVVRAGRRETLPSPRQTLLNTGDGVDVNAQGRAILRFADLLTVELLRNGGLVLQELSADEQSAIITVLQNGGTLINDFNPGEEITRRFTIQTEFAVITATGTRFMVVREANAPLEWVIGLDVAEGDLKVSAGGETKPITTGIARWVAPIGPPSAGIPANMANVQSWIEGVRAGEPRREIGEVVWDPADILANTQSVTELPDPGQPFELEGVVLMLDPQGLFGNPVYSLADCNGDRISDIAIQAGKLQMDFRPVPRRVRALDVTVVNRDRPGSGSLRALDPGRTEISSQFLRVGPGQGEVLSLRSDRPYHFAELLLNDGCFLGFSLTPPTLTGENGPPRPAVEGLETGDLIPTSTATPSTQIPLCTVVYTGRGGVNLRSGPGTFYEPPLEVLPKDTELIPLARSPDGQWIQVQVRSSRAQGWISANSRFVQCNVPIGELPLGKVPPTPSPTPFPTSTPTPMAPSPPSPLTATIVHPKEGEYQPATTELVFQVQAYDPSVGQHDGDGIAYVDMRILNSDRTEVHQRTERNAGYCAFGGGEPDCNRWVFAEHNYRWPNGEPIISDIYTLKATVYARSGHTVTVQTTIQIQWATTMDDFLGHWVNTDRDTSGMTRLIIEPLDSSTVSFHGYGRCHPTDCDWGTVAVPFQPPQLVGIYHFGFKITRIAVERSGQYLLAEVFDDYTEADGRPDRTSHYVLERLLFLD
jgi:hypothetical protein